MKKILFLFLLSGVWPGLVKGQITQPYGSVTGNGGSQMSGGSYQLNGTVGQTVIGMMYGGSKQSSFNGFWYRPFASQIPQLCSGSGTITREVWSNVSGTSVSSIPLNTKPTSTSILTSLESPNNTGDNYGVRIRGYICIPQTDMYTFYLAADDNAELWIGETEASKVKLVSVTGWTNPKEWTKYPSQKSAPYVLSAGTKFYVEILHKEGVGGDNLAVGWSTGTVGYQSPITVIPGSVLSPYTAPSGRVAGEAKASPETANEGLALKAYPNPFSDHVTLQFTATETAMSTLVLLDAQGMPVRKVLEETVEAGVTKTVEVSGRDLKPGMYLVRLTSGRRVSHQKLVLMR